MENNDVTCPICKTPPYVVSEAEYKCGCGHMRIPKDEYEDMLRKEAEISRGGYTYDDIIPIQPMIKKVINDVMHEDGCDIDDFAISALYTLTGVERIQFLEKWLDKIKYMALNTLRRTTVLCDDVYDVVKTLAKTSDLTSPAILDVMNLIIELYEALELEIKPENHVCLPLKNGKHTSLFEIISILPQLRMALNSHYGATTGMIVKNSDITRNKY